MDGKKSYGELEEEIASLKRQLAGIDGKYREALGQVESLRKAISFLGEAFELQKVRSWVKSSEKLSKAQKEMLTAILNRTGKTDEKQDDIGESGDDAQGPDAHAPEEPSDEDFRPIAEPKCGKNKRGRQPGVKTRGRNTEFLGRFRQEDVECDMLSGLSEDEKKGYRFIGKKLVRTELSYRRACIVTHRIYSYTYMSPDGSIVNSPVPPQLIPGSMLSNGLLAAVACDKTLYGLSIGTISERLLACAGVENPAFRQTLNYGFMNAASAVTSLYEAVRGYITGKGAIHGDETRLMVIDNTATGKPSLGYVWAMYYDANADRNDHPACFYRFFPGRGLDAAREFYGLLDRNTALQTDAYAAYESLAEGLNEYWYDDIMRTEGQDAAEEFRRDEHDGIVLAGCTAHMRRRFYYLFRAHLGMDCSTPSPEAEVCMKVLSEIDDVYEAEKRLRSRFDCNDITDAEFTEIRTKEIEPVYDRLLKYAKEKKEKCGDFLSPKMKDCLTYLINQTDTIKNFLKVPEFTPDNNSMERQLRRFTKSRNSSLFATSVKGAVAWTKLLTLAQLALINKVNPHSYLEYVFNETGRLNRDRVPSVEVDWSMYFPWNIPKDKLKSLS